MGKNVLLSVGNLYDFTLMKYELKEINDAYMELVNNEKMMGTVIGALIGLVPASMVFIIFIPVGNIIFLMLLIPPIIVGLFARFTGQPFRLETRLPVGILAFLLHTAGCYAFQLSLLVYLLAPVCAGIAIVISKVKLSRLQRFAVDYVEE